MWREWQTEHRSASGRKRRVPKRIPIRISGAGPNDTYFTEKSETVNISYDGCCFLTYLALPPGTVIAIRVAEKNMDMEEGGKRGLFRMLWQKKIQGGFQTGAREILPHNLWNLDELSEVPAGQLA